MQPQQPWSPHGSFGPSPYAQPAPQPNPYAAPGPGIYRQNVFVPHGATSGPLVSPSLRKVKLVTGIAQIVTLLGGVAAIVLGTVMNASERDIAAAFGLAFLGLFYLLLIAYGVANLVWIYKFWAWIPPEHRYTSMWKKYISPGMAVGLMLVPYFNLYWMFVVYLGLADIMERLRVQYPCSKGPAKTLAILTIVVPMVFFPAGPFLQYMFAKHLEEMAAEMQARMPSAAQSPMMQPA